MMNSALQTWLINANNHYGKIGMPHLQRGFAALSDFSKNHNCSLSLDSGTGKEILNWFEANSPEGSHAIGSIFTGAFYYDAYFWPLHVPVIFGAVTIGPFDSLETMPQLIKQQLAASEKDNSRLTRYWCNCVDYGYGHDDLQIDGKVKGRALTFLKSADSELRGAISQLVMPRPNTKAILGLRMAAELFLKTRLVHETDMSEAELRKFGHNIKKLADQCHALTRNSEYAEIARNAHRFPDISARYEGSDWPHHEVWNALIAVQSCAALFCGDLAGRKISNSLRPNYGGKV